MTQDTKQIQRGGEEPFNGVKVFSATMAQERDQLGERITAWLRDHPSVKVVDTIVTQSSDESFHCLAITLFYWEDQK
ncbi:MAG TPA: hypothetical protein VKN99_27630 [Polyangia bacterium]|nr:hypothetical protein [Polyangia bacterium]